MEENPYASSAPAPQDIPSQGPVTPGDFQTGKSLDQVFEAFQRHWFLGSVGFLAITIFNIVAFVGFAFLSVLLADFSPEVGGMVSTLVHYLLQIGINFGGTWMALAAVRSAKGTESLSLDTIFRGFQSFGTIVLVSLLLFVIGLAVVVPGIVLCGVILSTSASGGRLDNPDELLNQLDLLWPLIPVAILFILVPTVFCFARLYFSILIAVDRNRGPIEAIKESWQLTEGNTFAIVGYGLFWTLFFVLLSPFLLLGIALTCGLGIFPVGFLTLLPAVVLYKMLTDHLPRDADQKVDGISIRRTE